MDGLALFPAGGDLENGGSAEAEMREEHFLAEEIFSGGGDHFGGDAGEFGVAFLIGTIKNQGNERGTSRNDVVAELSGEIVAERGGTHFRDGESTSGDNEDGSAELCGIGTEDEFGGAANFVDAGVQEDLNPGVATFGFEQIGDVRCGIVAEELA